MSWCADNDTRPNDPKTFSLTTRLPEATRRLKSWAAVYKWSTVHGESNCDTQAQHISHEYSSISSLSFDFSFKDMFLIRCPFCECCHGLLHFHSSWVGRASPVIYREKAGSSSYLSPTDDLCFLRLCTAPPSNVNGIKWSVMCGQLAHFNGMSMPLFSE